MVAALREPITDDEIGDELQSRIWEWGVVQKHGYWPQAKPDERRSDTKPDSRLCVPPWLTEISIAFARLNPTAPLPLRGFRLSHIARQHFDRDQLIVWLYYVEEMGHKIAHELTVSEAEQRGRIQRVRHVPTGQRTGDRRVGDIISLSAERTRKLRYKAVDRMAAALPPGVFGPDIDDDPGMH